MKLAKSNKVIYFSALLTMGILSGIFLNSFYWPYEGAIKRKIVVGIIVFFCIVIVPILTVKVKFVYEWIQTIVCRIKCIFQYVKKEKKKLLLLVGILFGVIVISRLLTGVICRWILQTSYNSRLFETFVALSILFVVIGFIWKTAAKHQEYVFLIVVLIMGFFCISVTPNRVGVSWDDEIHYQRTLDISNVLNGIMYEADERNIQEYAENIYGRTGYDRESDNRYDEELSASYKAKEWNAFGDGEYGVWTISYIPAAVGIILARGLGLSYVNVFNMGRLFNLLSYACLIYFSMKRIKYGKMIIATIGLIPTTVFMASSYSYDWWVTGFTNLGLSYFFAELQESETLKNKNIVIMLGAIVLGCLPKATYFLMMFPMLFMPKEKFASSKQRKYYYLSVIGTVLFLVSTFMLPLLINGAGQGDLRGGTDVNSAEQIKFIFNNPLLFTRILLEFELDYVALANSASMLQRFAYVGDGYFYSIISLMLIVLAFLDRSEHEANHYIIKGAGLIGCAAAIILSTTALYISFTALASDTVAGMQARYMVPTIFPALFSLGVGGITHKINKNAFVCVPMVIVALSFIANMFKFCVLYY